jgi:colanic acid/amylovoran biosynthesis glycosyltransferase
VLAHSICIQQSGHVVVRIAYFINQYPAVSHTFIRREIRALEVLGMTIFRYALRLDPNLVDSEDEEEGTRTRYILTAGAGEIARCFCAMLVSRPWGLCRAIGQAIRLGWRSDRGIARHLAYVAEAAVLALWCRQDHIEHIHSHFGTNSAAVAMLASHIGGIPYSFTVHGPEEFDKAPLIGLAEKIRHCKFVIAISSYGRSQLYRCVERKYWTKIQIVHCGIEPAAFDAVSEFPASDRRLVCVGRLSAQKGHLILIEAAQRLAQRGIDFEIVLCGDGEMRGEIETFIEQQNLQARVSILGWVDGPRVRREVLSARALVLPSFAEGLPVVLIEAMALKRPVISTFVAGIPELVVPGESGWLVPASDVEALASAIQACLAANRESLICMGEAAQIRALSRHNVNTEAAKLLALFETTSLERIRRERHMQKGI